MRSKIGDGKSEFHGQTSMLEFFSEPVAPLAEVGCEDHIVCSEYGHEKALVAEYIDAKNTAHFSDGCTVPPTNAGKKLVEKIKRYRAKNGENAKHVLALLATYDKGATFTEIKTALGFTTKQKLIDALQQNISANLIKHEGGRYYHV